ncbi:reverse transcriptase domain-containing protein [Tanacetum coccineum]|uniref:Reverse transcriptase domain-containing protein n=1 Tax=Tanacetum coccineum TaxID=301880 RepID=A0ABQ5A228_9ASTR
MSPRRARAATTNNTANAPMSAAVINQLIKTRVAEALANQDIISNNSTNGDGSQNSGFGTVKFTTCTILGIALTWWNSHVKAVGLDVAYVIPWKILSNMMTAKYYPRSEIKKLEHEIWNLKVKDEVEKYMGRLPNMIQGNVMYAMPKTMQEAIELANDLMDQKVCTYAERQLENKRKQEENSRSNHNQQ